MREREREREDGVFDNPPINNHRWFVQFDLSVTFAFTSHLFNDRIGCFNLQHLYCSLFNWLIERQPTTTSNNTG